MHGFSPHLVAALLLPRDHYEPDDDLRTLRRLAAQKRAVTPRRRLPRLPRRRTAWPTIANVPVDEQTTTTVA